MARKRPQKKTLHRDARTGRFITKEEAQRRPSTTVKESR